jgi:nitrogen fixation protein FixH
MMTDLPAAAPRVITGRHVLIAVVAFFVVVVGLDALFTVWAVRTFPGEVSPRAYEDGLAYNRILAERRAEAALGWTSKVTQGARPGQITVRFTDGSGKPIEGLTVKADFNRPATQAGARTARLASAVAGEYAGGPALAEGAWDLTLTAADAQGREFQARRRLVWR